MDLALDILQGAGLAAACGVRPFLPALLAGAAATQDAALDFDATSFDFLEASWFLLVLVILYGAFLGAERRFGPDALDVGPLGAALAGLGIALGILLAAGSIDDRHAEWWIGIPVGLGCALLAEGAVRGLLRRTRARLDEDAALALTLYAEGAALVIAIASLAFPPLALVALALLAWLLVTGRRREGAKYAGLRILR